MDRACKAVKTDGTRCQARPLQDSELCFWHDPSTEHEANEARRLGGSRRKRESAIVAAYDLGELGGLEDYEQVLRTAILDTMSLENSVSRNRTLGSLVAIGMSLVEKNEFAAKLKSVESVLGPRLAQPDKKRSWWRR
jgi:hypothetical protein